MFRRIFWFAFGLGLGAVTGIWLTRTVDRARRRLSPEQVARQMASRVRERARELRVRTRDYSSNGYSPAFTGARHP